MNKRRRCTLGLAAAASLLLVGTSIANPAPRLVWNASASAPLGLYRIYPGAPISVGDLVIARVPPQVRRLAAERSYLPLGVPLVKRAVATSGTQICERGTTVSIAGQPVARRRARDQMRRRLPSWQGCRTLRRGDLFLLMADIPDSFDGRYFGPTAARDVIGKAVPLWLR